MAREVEALVDNYQHLDFPRDKEALHMLKKIASVIKPIMRKHGWRVGTLTEFYPSEHNLLGLNVNHGQRICIRLRYANDRTLFLPLENCIDTMLHELSHNVVGPHNAQFHELWNSLRDEYDDLKIKGFTGEGFLTQGHRLGGYNVPINEARRRARIAAEQRVRVQKDSGHRLGGQPIQPGQDIRNVIANATKRRTTITEGCASNTREGDVLANEASYNGFRTKAEEDDANQRAIEQALWELYQEEEIRKAGLDPDTQLFANGGEGLHWDPRGGLALNTAVQRFTSENSPSLPESPTTGLGPLPALPDCPPIPSKSPLRKSAALNVRKGSVANDIQVPRGMDKESNLRRPVQATSALARSVSSESNLSPQSSRSSVEHTLPTLHPTVFEPSASTGPPGQGGDGLPTLSAVTYTPPIKRKFSESPLMVDISSFDDDYKKIEAGPATLRVASSSLTSKSWTCPQCTLNNRIDFLQCEACCEEQPDHASAISALTTTTSILEQRAEYEAIAVARQEAVKRESQLRQRAREAERQQRMQAVERERLAAQHAERERLYNRAPPRPQTGPIGWNCTACGTFMETRWWACTACHTVKDSS